MTSSPKDRDALLPAIAAGDVQAFAVWLRDAEPRVRLSLARFARAIDTEAIVQETLLRIWQVAARIEPDPRGDTLIRVAVQIAHNLSIDHVRRSRRLALAEQRELLALAADRADESPPPDPLLRDVIARCMAKLPPQPSASLIARLQNVGAEADEALAARLGMQLNTFLKNIGRARQLLVDCLKARGVSVAFAATARGGR